MKKGTDISLAAALLRAGQVVAIPTENVYGLAANAYDPEAVIKIFEIKQRPRFNPLIVHVHSWDMADRVAISMDRQLRNLAEAFWPGPLTLLLPKSELIHSVVTAGSPLVAVRMPNHPVALELLQLLDLPLAAPSANVFGKISPTTAEHVAAQLGDQIAYILDGGPCEIGVESTIVKINASGKTEILRQGGISADAMADIIGYIPLMGIPADHPEAPGMLKSHYAPAIPLVIGQISHLLELYGDRNTAVLGFNTSFHHPSIVAQCTLSSNSNLHEAARNLFACLHRLEDSDAEIILAELAPETGIGAAINDRLRKAAHDANVKSK